MAMYSSVSDRLIAALQQPPALTPQDCACPPPCPVCGGLECLCRPRFFPGQVLTDDDLNRLEHYVIAKNKLHNRYFHGSGVVCGLEVVCDPCSATNVTVKPGYGLSPCGDDIIVCKDASVNVCDLINKCKPKNDCDPYGAQAPADCKQGIQRFVLSICYSETPSRGVQPLMSEPCACSCAGNCGGSCGCAGSSGCSCGNTAAAPAKKATKTPSKYNAQCEPTLICEGFNFLAGKYAPAATGSDVSRFGVWGVIASKATQFGPLFTRLLLCYFKAQEIKGDYSAQVNARRDTTQLAIAYGEYGAALREFAAAHASHRCDLARRLACLDLPASVASNNARDNALRQATLSKADYVSRIDTLNTLWLEVLRECFCSALLPPCAGPQGSDCIPLAVLTVDVDKCQVIEICNWSAREFALTLPSVFYWTSFIDWGAIKDAVSKLCCGTADQRIWELLFATLERTVAANTATTQAAPAMEARIAAAGGATAPTTPSAQTSLDTYTALVGFLERATAPAGMAHMLSAAQPASQAGDIAALRQTVDALHKKVNEQAAHIDELRRR